MISRGRLYYPPNQEEIALPKPSIHDVKHVEVFEALEIVHKRLAEGWILLHVYSDTVPSDYGPAQVPVYVLGYTGL